jgi:hypothetical protein
MSAMDERKRHISFGLPGRLSINGFSEEDAGSALRPFLWVSLGLSSVLLTAYILAWTGKPAIAKPLLSLPFWVLPALGIGAAVTAYRRPLRLAAGLLIVFWFVAFLQLSR